MNVPMMRPSTEHVGDQPSKAPKDYRACFSKPCMYTVDTDFLLNVYQGTGIGPEHHPLERQFAMLRVPFVPCARCSSTNLNVIYAYFTCPPTNDYAPGEVICGYEVVCIDCQAYTYRHYEL